MSALKRKASFESETARVSREIPSLWGIWRKANVDKRIDIDKRERKRERKEGRKRVRDAGNVKIGTRAGSVTTAISHLSDRI